MLFRSLVLAVKEAYGPLEVPPIDAEPVQKTFPALAGVRELSPALPRGLRGAGLIDAVAVFTRGAAPIMARRVLGRGDIWMIANPDMLENEGLGKADHLRLLIGLAGSGRPVVFDEHVHGISDELGSVELLRRWGLGPAMFLFALSGIAWFWRRAVTVGPPPPWRDARSESVDLVYAVSALYRRALKPSEALSLHHSRLIHEIQLRLGLRDEAAQARARDLTRGWTPPPDARSMSEAEFQHHLQILNDAFRSLRDDRRRRRR